MTADTPEAALARADYENPTGVPFSDAKWKWAAADDRERDVWLLWAKSIQDRLAALGYEVRPIEQAAEAADREAAGRDEARKPTSAAADLDALARDSLPLLRWVLPAGYVFDGVRRLYENGQPLDRWEVRAVKPIEQAAEAADREAAGEDAEPPSDSAAADSLEWNATRELMIEKGPVVIAQTRTDPGDMGEPRVFESDGTTYVAVPDFDGEWGVPSAAADGPEPCACECHRDPAVLLRDTPEDRERLVTAIHTP